MLRITKQTDYGILLLAHLASLPAGHILSARDAAASTGLTLPMVSKIFKCLARSEVVSSHRGVGGGYSLARPPRQTTLASVIRALEGPISMVECGSHPGLCLQESTCNVRLNWARVSREVERALDRVPITEMVEPGRSPLLSVTDGCSGTAPQRGTR